VTEVPGVTINSTRPIQMITVGDGALQFIAIPDGDRMLLLDSTMKLTVFDRANMEADFDFTDARGLASSGLNLYTVAKVAGVYNVLTVKPNPISKSATLEAPTPLTGAAVVRIGAMIAVDSSTLLAVDEGNHTLVKINIATGATTVFSGQAATVGKPAGKLPAADFTFSEPSGLVQNASDIYIADTGNQRIVRLNADDTLEPFAGSGAQGLKSGTLTASQIEQPMSLTFGSNLRLMVCGYSRSAIQQVDPRAMKCSRWRTRPPRRSTAPDSSSNPLAS